MPITSRDIAQMQDRLWELDQELRGLRPREDCWRPHPHQLALLSDTIQILSKVPTEEEEAGYASRGRVVMDEEDEKHEATILEICKALNPEFENPKIGTTIPGYTPQYGVVQSNHALKAARTIVQRHSPESTSSPIVSRPKTVSSKP